ncbi:MAG: GNAT family protein, partial [Bacteroidota bacterium]
SFATLALVIGNKEYWGKGVGTEAINLATNYVFDVLKLREANLGVVADHKVAIKLYEKCGYHTYKVEPQSLNYDGIIYDHTFMKKLKRQCNMEELNS